ncbi:MAG: alanine dehydrogenase [Candidatus Cloacimonadota bacterium]|nr:MAG: alanine dehydrogenase [Candidatus Cloacimonadota bacterium]
MIIGIPKEIKNNENRVGLVPGNVNQLVHSGHTVYVQETAGIGTGFSDQDYIDAGAKMLSSIQEIYAISDMIIKVKEPIQPEYNLLKENQILFTYLHLAADEKLTKVLLDRKIIGIAYETVTDNKGGLPLLNPMSEIAGRLATQIGATLLQKANGGRGVLLGGVPGVLPGKVVVLGGGIVGFNSAQMALGLGADVTIMDVNTERMRYLSEVTHGRLKTVMSNRANIISQIKEADLVIGAVLIAGKKAPHLITRDMLKFMKPNTVICDVAVDQGGCFETTKATTHDDPTFVVDGILHYCVANMPGAVPLTSTYALNNVTLPFAEQIAKQGIDCFKSNPHLLNGLNVYKGQLTCQAVADAHNLKYTNPNNITELQ